MEVDWKLYNVNLLEPYTGYRVKILFECLNCSNQWKTSPQVVKRGHALHGTNGCPSCNEARKVERYEPIQLANKASLPAHIKVKSDWNGKRNYTGVDVTFYNSQCGHTFATNPHYILSGKSECTTCGKEQRIAELIERSEATRVYDNPEKWLHYVSLVDKFTRRTYKAHKDVINPLNLPRARNGTKGAYQLDHIVSKIEGFVREIPAERLSQIDNLQMLSWEDNIAKKEKLLWIPLTMKEFFTKSHDLVDTLIE